MNLASDMLFTLPKGGSMASLRALSKDPRITYLLTPYALGYMCTRILKSA